MIRPVRSAARFAAALLAILALPAPGAADESDRPLRALLRWAEHYRAGRIDFAVESYYRQYAHARTSFLVPPPSAADPNRRAGVAEVVHAFRDYRRGRIEGSELARWILGRRGVRRIDNLATYAELLIVFDAAARAEASPRVLERTAEVLLGLAVHAHGGSLVEEGERWGVYRRRHPILVRREALRHLSALAARSPAARARLLEAARSEAGSRGSSRRAGEAALLALASLDLSRLDATETYAFGRALTEVVTRARNSWTALAASRLIGRLDAPYHGHLLVWCLKSATGRLAAGEGSPGAMVARALCAAAEASVKRWHAAGQFDSPWSGVATSPRVLVEALLRMVEDYRLESAVRRDALRALEAAPHWRVVRGLRDALRTERNATFRDRIFAALRRATRFSGEDPGAWERWYAFHHRGEDGPLPPPRYAPDPEPARFYGVPVVGERILFLIDTSGSMADPLDRGGGSKPDRESKIGKTRAELIRVIEGLDDRRRFNTVFFDDAPTRLFATLVPATAAHRAAAVERIKGLGGSGWTDLGAAILSAFGRTRPGQSRPLPALRAPADASGSDPGRARPDQIILLSDGMPSKGDLFVPGDLVDEIERLNRGLGIRIDTVGLGGESDPFLLEEIARRNGGTTTIFPAWIAAAFRRM
jgi:hypothetical protein